MNNIDKRDWKRRLLVRVKELREQYQSLIDEADEHDDAIVGGKYDQLREQAEHVKEDLALDVISMADMLIETEAREAQLEAVTASLPDYYEIKISPFFPNGWQDETQNGYVAFIDEYKGVRDWQARGDTRMKALKAAIARMKEDAS